MNTDGQVAKLEQLLARVKQNRARMEEDRLAGPSAAPESALTIPDLPVPEEPAPASTTEPEPVLEPVVEPALKPALEPEPMLEPIPETEPVEVAEPELEPLPDVEPPSEPPVVSIATAPAEEEKPQVFDSSITASGPVAQTHGEQKRTWTLEAVLDRAWKLGG